MACDIRFLVLYSDDDPPLSWARDAYRSIAGRAGALALSVTEWAPRIQKLENLLAIADLVVADLSSERPDIYFLCGIAHARRVRTLLLVQEGRRTHFNLSGYSVQTYSRAEDIIMAAEGAMAEAHAAQETAEQRSGKLRQDQSARRLAAISAFAHSLPRCVSRPTIAELRESLGTTPLSPEQSGFRLDEISNGHYGYAWIPTLQDCIADYQDAVADGLAATRPCTWTLSAERGISGVEVLKAQNGTVYLAGTGPRWVEAALIGAQAEAQVSIRLYVHVDEGPVSAIWAQRLGSDLGTPLAIPVARVRRVFDHSGHAGNVLEMTIDCCT